MEFLTLDVAPPVAHLRLRRPPLNIFTIAMMKEARAALASLAGRNVRVLILSGDGKGFCAGVDVGEHVGATCEPMIREFHGLFRDLLHLPCAVVAAVHGACLGGGAELLLACDDVVAAEDAKIGFPEIRLGVFPPIACAALPRAVGALRARRLILRGETISGAEAAKIGLATEAVPGGRLAASAADAANRFASLSGAAIGLTRRAIADLDLARVEDFYLGPLMKTADAAEGLAAFLDKRPPKWTDR